MTSTDSLNSADQSGIVEDCCKTVANPAMCFRGDQQDACSCSQVVTQVSCLSDTVVRGEQVSLNSPAKWNELSTVISCQLYVSIVKPAVTEHSMMAH